MKKTTKKQLKSQPKQKKAKTRSDEFVTRKELLVLLDNQNKRLDDTENEINRDVVEILSKSSMEESEKRKNLSDHVHMIRTAIGADINKLNTIINNLNVKVETFDNRLRHLEQVEKESKTGDKNEEGRRKLLEAKFEGLRNLPHAFQELAQRVEALEKKKDDKPPVSIVVIK